ncbi:hypothetical protein EVAR_65167_1 [Eumeta japonica]|uniref:Nucleic-acid-binding protein from transposon X-element n=1 Tax=Eumeta variegata TaxID=151549 RepID=A0A4C1ZGA6_EUMVA|nr:hypothetical protein EVAR_65167_1 [Eumeta japonica]
MYAGSTGRSPYRKRVPGQCHRCQMYGHAAANCYAQPRCVKCLVPHWTKDCERFRNQETDKALQWVEPQSIITALSYCCPMDIPPLTNIEATACRLSTIGHGVLTLVHITTVVENSSRKVPAKSDRKELPRDVIELIR